MTSVIVTSFPCFSIVTFGLFGSFGIFGAGELSNGSFAGISSLTGRAPSGPGEVSKVPGGISVGADSVGEIGVSAVGTWGLSGRELVSEIWFSGTDSL